jgi:hypothetical protein
MEKIVPYFFTSRAYYKRTQILTKNFTFHEKNNYRFLKSYINYSYVTSHCIQGILMSDDDSGGGGDNYNHYIYLGYSEMDLY